MTRGALGAIGTVLFLLGCATALLEGWSGSWVVVGIGLGWYWGRVELHYSLEVRWRDEVIRRAGRRAGR